MKTAIFPVLALCATAIAMQPGQAQAACHFSSPVPIVCYQGLPAAIAWQRYGNDYVEIAQSYTQRILNEAGCGTPFTRDQLKKAVIELRTHGRVATSDGWVPVSLIEVDRRDEEIYYIADAYLTGTCAKYKLPPPVIVPTEK